MYTETRNEVDELIDAQLVQSARVLLNLLSHEFHEEEAYRGRLYEEETRNVPQDLSVFGHKYEQKLAFQMWMLASNRLALRSQSAPETPMTDLLDGFSDRLIHDNNGDQRMWRVYALTDINRGLQVQVGEHAKFLGYRREQGGEVVQLHAEAFAIVFALVTSVVSLMKEAPSSYHP